MVFSQTIGPIELKFHVKTPYDKLAKIYVKYFGHMTKMTAMPIYGKNPLKIFFSRTRRLMTLQGSHEHWKTWKITKKSSMHGKIMEFEKN